MGQKTIYFKEKTIEGVIKLLNMENISVTSDNIKIWGCDQMNIKDVIFGCNYVKNRLSSDVIVYTNIVPQRAKLEKSEKVRIFDESVLKDLCIKHKEYDLYDCL